MKKIMNLIGLLLIVSATSVFADQPDLEFNGWTATSVMEAGEVGIVSAVVLNKRGVDSGEFRVTFDISPSSYKLVEGSLSQTVQNLGPGGQIMPTIKFVLQEKTTYKIKIMVDPDDSVSETNEQNNFGVAEISVGAGVVTAPRMPEVLPPALLPKPEAYPGPELPEAPVEERYPVPPPMPAEELYGECMRELARLKDDINRHYEAGKQPADDLLRKYEELSRYCETLHPGYQPPVRPLEKAEECIGCKRDHSCLQFGIRLVENGVPVYCDIDGLAKPQKQNGESAQNNYECLSNTAADGRCVSITERIEAVEREVKEQRGLIEKILDFFRRWFGG